jgi:hypothetical protein
LAQTHKPKTLLSGQFTYGPTIRSVGFLIKRTLKTLGSCRRKPRAATLLLLSLHSISISTLFFCVSLAGSFLIFCLFSFLLKKSFLLALFAWSFNLSIGFDALGFLEVVLCVFGSGFFRFWLIVKELCGSLINQCRLSDFLHDVCFLGFGSWIFCGIYVRLIRIFDISDFVFCFWFTILCFCFCFLSFYFRWPKVW